MVEKILMWAALLVCGIPALMFLLSAVACIFAGRLTEGIYMFWLGCFSAACAAFVWWSKQEEEKWDKEANKRSYFKPF